MLHERIKKLRKALNLTQQEFANRIRISRGALATYEIGRNEPIDAVIALICREFGVNETWLRTGEGEIFLKFPNTALEELAVDFYLDAFDEALVNEYLHLTPDQRKTFRTFFYRVLVKSIGDAGPDELLKTEMNNYPTARIPDPAATPRLQPDTDGQEVQLAQANDKADFMAKASEQYDFEKIPESPASSAKESGAV